MIKALTTATSNPYPVVCWWNDSEISDLVNEAVKQGFARRHSVTQVEWTEKGIAEYKIATEKEVATSLPIANGEYTLQTFADDRNRPCLKITTKRGKVICNYYYKTEAERDASAVKNGERLERYEQDKIDRRTGAKGKKEEAIKAIEVGTIFYTSWGYDQTNVDFYQVVKISGLKIQVREIWGEERATGFMRGEATPVKDSFRDEKETLTVGLTNSGGFKIDGHYASIHKDGDSHYASHYA